MIESLLKNCVFEKVIDDIAAGTGSTNGDIVDMKGFDRAAFVVALGDVVDTSVITIKVEQGDESDLSDAADISGSSVSFTAGAATADDKLMITDVRPTKRYCRVVVTKATANAEIDAAIGVKYNGKKFPVSQSSTVVGSVFAA